MNISQKGLDFITEFEGFYPKAYKCQAGIWTIGIGTIRYPTGIKVSKNDTCSREDAERWLAFEVNEKCAYFNQVIQKINLVLEQNEYDALVSFLYNVGIGKCYQGTTMGDAIYTKHPDLIAEAFLVYNKYTWYGVKRISKGLDRRRKAEKVLFEGVA
jgi:lysozyme